MIQWNMSFEAVSWDMILSMTYYAIVTDDISQYDLLQEW